MMLIAGACTLLMAGCGGGDGLGSTLNADTYAEADLGGVEGIAENEETSVSRGRVSRHQTLRRRAKLGPYAVPSSEAQVPETTVMSAAASSPEVAAPVLQASPVDAPGPEDTVSIVAAPLVGELSVDPSESGLILAAADTSRVVGASSSTLKAATNTDFHPAGYELAFTDDFNGSTLDRTKWCTRYLYAGGAFRQIDDSECGTNGWGTLDFLNDEQQRYVDTNTRGEPMHVISNGVLALRATRTRADTYASYEAAMLRSKQEFRPSKNSSLYITSRVKLPNVKGSWPAFWLNSGRNADGSSNWPPEIDIFEGALNEKGDTANMLRQGAQPQNWGGSGKTEKNQFTYVSPEFDVAHANYKASRSLRDVWIEVGVQWSEKQVCYFVDGFKTACEAYEWKTNAGVVAPAAHVLLNLAVGGWWAGGNGIDISKFPTAMHVDYVRVYQGKP